MKKILFGLAAVLTLALNSCTTDPCKDVNCGANGTCNTITGLCDCNDFYEGTSCETEWRAKAFGTYNGAEVCNTGNFNYQVMISTSNVSVDRIIFDNLYDQNINIYGEMLTSTTFNIPSQAFGAGTIAGNGSINGTTVTATYTVNVAGATDNCTLTLTPQ